jgi:hypothetical protein
MVGMKIFAYLLFGGVAFGLMRLGLHFGVTELESGVTILVVTGIAIHDFNIAAIGSSTEAITTAVYSRKPLG